VTLILIFTKELMEGLGARNVLNSVSVALVLNNAMFVRVKLFYKMENVN